ncbi:Exocyst complex component 7, partial [Fasciola hepatica]
SSYSDIQECYSKLSQIQTYRKTAAEVESLIEQGPSQSLEAYLKVMERIQKAFVFFREHNVEEVELVRLQSLYALGLKNLNREFEAMLKQTFRPVNLNYLLKLSDSDDSKNDSSQSSDLRALEDASDPLLNNLQFIMEWMQQSRAFDPNGEGARNCLSRYHDYRREVVRQTLIKLRTLLRERETQDTGQFRPKSAPTATSIRSRPKRPPGFIWEANVYRHLNDGETEELNSEHYGITVVALVKLMQNEQRWLNRLQLTTTDHERQVSLDMILKVASNELLNDGSTLVRFMQQAQTRAEFHMVLSLLFVLKKFAQIGSELVGVLKSDELSGPQRSGIDHILFGFNSLVFKLLQQTCNTLEAYVEFLRQLPEHSGLVRAQVPPDGTVHELTTNAFMYLENLLEFAGIMSIAVHVNDIGPQGSSNVLTFLSHNVVNCEPFRPRVGAFLLSAIFALIANLDRKSESYSEEIVRLIFRMNNLQYILKTVQNTQLHQYLLSYDSEAIARISSLMDERRGRYSLVCVNALVIPNMNQLSRFGGSSGRALDTKERAALKSLWHDFNTGLNNLIRQHSGITVPDKELRDALERQLIADLIPPYRMFWDRSANIGFSSHRDKYMRVSVQDLEMRLKQLLIGSG